MISKDLLSSKFCDYILNVRTSWHLLASPLMKLSIIYLIQRKHTPRVTDQPGLKMRVCGFLSCPQLSSDACDKCVCLLKKKKKSQLPWGDLTCLFVWTCMLNMFYFNVVLYLFETWNVAKNESLCLVPVGKRLFYKKKKKCPCISLSLIYFFTQTLLPTSQRRFT